MRTTGHWLFSIAATGALLGCSERGGAVYSGTVELKDVRVGSLVGGRVLAVHADEGQVVEAGSVLFRIDPVEWNAQLAEARAEADAAAKKLALLVAGTRKEQVVQAAAEAERQRLLWQVVAAGSREEEIGEAAHRLEAAEADAALARSEHARIANLAQSDDASEQELDVAARRSAEATATVAALRQRLLLLQAGLRPEEIDAAEQSYRKAEAYVAELEAGPRKEEIDAARAESEAAAARAAFIESKLAELTVHAPARALLQTLDLRPGDLVAAGEPVAILLLAEECRMTIYVPEDRLAAAALGQAAEVRFDGLDRPVAGRVSWISRTAEFTPRNVQTRSERVTQVFAVRIDLEGDVTALKDGLWGEARLQ